MARGILTESLDWNRSTDEARVRSVDADEFAELKQRALSVVIDEKEPSKSNLDGSTLLNINEAAYDVTTCAMRLAIMLVVLNGKSWPSFSS